MQKTITACLLFFMAMVQTQVSHASALSGVKIQEDQGKQTEVTVDGVASGEVNTVQESDLAKEMIQEEQQEASAAEGERMAKTEAERKAKQKEKAEAAAENDSHGFAITIIAMVIVIFALIILSLLFQLFGKISSSLHKARKIKAHGVNEHEVENHHEELDSGEVIAAISMALAEHLGQGHDIEDTILTIRKLRKAYSPWNSKIYNMRLMPEHERASRNPGKTPA